MGKAFVDKGDHGLRLKMQEGFHLGSRGPRASSLRDQEEQRKAMKAHSVFRDQRSSQSPAEHRERKTSMGEGG